MPYFFGARRGDRVTIGGADARHLARSLRARPGETIYVVEPAGRLLEVRLETVAAAEVTGRVVAETEHRPEPRCRVTLAVAMLPSSALETVLAQGTQLGAGRFLLVAAQRSVARGAKPERWATVCREAAMLAGRLTVPVVEGPAPLEQALATAENPLLLDRSAGSRLADADIEDAVTLFVGPEGGWTRDELAAAGARVRSLGPRNLRAETAALAALTVALAVTGDL